MCRTTRELSLVNGRYDGLHYYVTETRSVQIAIGRLAIIHGFIPLGATE